MHLFTPFQRSKLLANRNVLDASERTVTFAPDFKIRAVKQYIDGSHPNHIFENAGLPLEYFQEDYCRSCIKRWAKKYKEEGEEALRTDSRGKNSPGRPKSERPEDLTYEELLVLVEIQKGALEELRKQRALAKKKS